jgi:hypothetical protein
LYAEKRNALAATLKPVAFEGNVGTSFLTKEDRERIKPESIELDMLIGAMVERTLKDGEIAWQCLERLHGVLEKEFDLKHWLELKEGYRAFDRAKVSNQAGLQPYYHHYKG